MSILKHLENITDEEKIGLRQTLLDRILELTEKLETSPYMPKHKVDHVEDLIKYNKYLYFWLEEEKSKYLH